MKSIKTALLFVLAALALAACRDEDRIRMPKLQEGVNMRVVLDPNRNAFTASNLANSVIEFDAYSINNNLSKVEFVGTYLDFILNNQNKVVDTVITANRLVLTLQASAFSNGKARGTISATQIASVFGLTGGMAGMAAPDQVIFNPVVTLTDGRVFSIENSAPSIAAGDNSSFTAQFSAKVK